MNRWMPILPAVLLGIFFSGMDDYHITFATRILIASIFALSLNLLVGYGGLMSLGHSAFFGLSGYAVAWLSVAQGWSAAAAVPMALLFSVVVAALFGVLALRARGIGFLMITLALGQIVWGLAVRWVDLTGGDSGIRGVVRPQLAGFSINDAKSFYILTALVFLAVCALLYRVVRSPFGASLRGTRDQPRRMSALGYNVLAVRWIAFVASGLLAAVAGILDVYLHKFISPEVLSLSVSAQALLMVIVGGSSVFLGPVAGAVLVPVFGDVVSGFIERWTAVLGLLFIVIVVYMPDGILPGLSRLLGRLRTPAAAPHVEKATP